MAQIILSGDGISITIDDEIARSDDLLKRALAPHYPDLANAQITREEKDGRLKVTLSKRAGPKGNSAGSEGSMSPDAGKGSVIQLLDSAPECLNPVFSLAWQMYHTGQSQGQDFTAGSSSQEMGESNVTAPDKAGFTLEQQLALQAAISEAILAGEAEAAQVQKAVERLKSAPAVPSRHVPKGF